MSYPPPPVTLAELTGRLTQAARGLGHKQLFCAPDVAEALTAALPAARPREPPGSAFHDAGIIAGLLAVDIIATPGSPPGVFRLIRHYDPTVRRTTCEVHGGTVSHHRCAVILEGTLTG